MVPADVLVEFTLFDHEAVVTAELLRVAAAIAAFTGLYFAISMLTDDVYRREFLEEPPRRCGRASGTAPTT